MGSASPCLALTAFGIICFGAFIFLTNNTPSGYLFSISALLTGAALIVFAIRLKHSERQSVQITTNQMSSVTLAGTIPALDPIGDVTIHNDASARRTERSSDDLADLPDLEIQIDPPPISISTEPGTQIDNTCKICYENASNLSMECGHIVCSVCIEKIRGEPGKVPCPYCHMTIDPTKIRPLYFV